MPIKSPFERLFDTPEEIEQQERDRQQDLAGAPEKKAAPPGGPPLFECRVCKLKAPQGGYCPECLADTMRPVKVPAT